MSSPGYTYILLSPEVECLIPLKKSELSHKEVSKKEQKADGKIVGDGKYSFLLCGKEQHSFSTAILLPKPSFKH